MKPKSPYKQHGKDPVLLPSFVCYADMLGYKNESRLALERREGVAYLKNLRAILNVAYRRLREGVGRTELRAYDMKVFTDNIIIGYPIDDLHMTSGESELGHIFNAFADHQVHLAMNGIFIRGGIAQGDHYMDDDIVFGDALLEAAEMDKSGAPPRLVLTPKVVELVRRHIGFYGSAEGAPHYRDLLEDDDGVIFINYLDGAFDVFSDTGEIFFEVFDKHRNFVRANLERFKDDARIRPKYEWVARYHNFICREFPAGYTISSDLYEYLEDGALHEYLINESELGGNKRVMSPRRISLTPFSR